MIAAALTAWESFVAESRGLGFAEYSRRLAAFRRSLSTDDLALLDAHLHEQREQEKARRGAERQALLDTFRCPDPTGGRCRRNHPGAAMEVEIGGTWTDCPVAARDRCVPWTDLQWARWVESGEAMGIPARS